MPEPYGPAAEVARRLELGELRSVSRLLLDPPPVEWVTAAVATQEERLLWPVAEGRLWRGFGRPPRGSRFKRRHKGIDIGAPEGSLIRAARSGLVVYADNGIRGYGNLLITVQADGSVVFYAHCRAVYLFPGQQVQRGQVVGEVGQTGRAIGAHVHFEYREQGRLRDPLPRFENRPAPATSAQRKSCSEAAQSERARSTGPERTPVREDPCEDVSRYEPFLDSSFNVLRIPL